MNQLHFRTGFNLVLAGLALWGAHPVAAIAQNGSTGIAASYELDHRTIDWSPVKGLIVETHRVIRVNRLAGAEVGRIRIWDTFYQKLKTLKGEVRDTTGRILFSVGMPDVRSVAPFSEFRLYSGDVVRAVDLVAPQAPYVIDVSWTVEIENAFFWPDWVLEDAWPRARAVYTVATPPDRSFRFREAMPGLTPTIERQARRDVMTWEIRDWQPPSDDPVATGPFALLYVAPEEFRVGRLKGRTDSWSELGKWYWSLTKDQSRLRVDQTFQVEQQVKNHVGDRATAAALKDWVSDQWRYVAIEVGLGGWRPGLASEVYDNRYGDCKDVVFLWIAMMRHIGLDARPALVRARNPLPIAPSFPKDWFDHVIAMTVIDGDTLWADLSDSRYPLGKLPRSCEARWALVVDEGGGELIATPVQSRTANQLATFLEGTVDTEGALTFISRVHASGHFARRFPLQGKSNPQQSAALILGVSMSSLEAQVDTVKVLSADAITVELHGTIRGWALAGQRQLVLRPRVGGWVANDTLGGRPDPGRVDFAQLCDDTLLIRLPDGWIPEYWPETKSEEEAQGMFSQNQTFADDIVRIERHLRWDAPGREDDDRRGHARLRHAYATAGGAEWLFRREVGVFDRKDDEPRRDAGPAASTPVAPANGSAHDSLGDTPPQSRIERKSATTP